MHAPKRQGEAGLEKRLWGRRRGRGGNYSNDKCLDKAATKKKKGTEATSLKWTRKEVDECVNPTVLTI